MKDKILQHRNGPIAHIIFNQPEKRNAVSLEMWETVDKALQTLKLDESIRALFLSGAGGKSFVAGADISKFDSERASKYKKKVNQADSFPYPISIRFILFCITKSLHLTSHSRHMGRHGVTNS